MAAFGQNLPSIATANGSPTQNRFSKMDTNGDGSISKAEWQAYGAQRAQARAGLLQTQEQSGNKSAHYPKGFGRSPEASQVFNQLDTNQDGTVSPEEWAAAFGTSNSASVSTGVPTTLTGAVNSVMQPVTDTVNSLVQTLGALNRLI
jgi:hypothetical protein